MKKSNHIKPLFIVITILNGLLYQVTAQTNLNFYQDETMFNNTSIGESLIHKANQEIKFLPGYNFAPRADIPVLDFQGNLIRTDNTNQHSYIDISNNFNNIYSGMPEDEFIDRELNTSLPVGAIAGQHNVDLSGAATYSIPIALPPGTNGLIPSLALNYNSLGQSNVLGMGWGVSGISRISKKSQAYNYAYYYTSNAQVKPINESLTYELDGEHFQRTELGPAFNFEDNKFKKVEYSTITNSFTVRTQEGLTYYYGTSTNSKKDGLFWNIDKIEDNYGNFIEYTYTSENLINEINYTGNSLQGISPYNKIKFTYKDREDKNTYYYAGQQISNNKLVEKIEVFAENQPVKKYRFNYSFNLYSYLYEIIESGADGVDLNSTIINYKEIEKLENYTQSGIPVQNAEYRTGDFNGDGKADVLAFVFNWVPNPYGPGNVKTYTHYNLYLNQGNGQFVLESGVGNGTLPQNFYPFESLGDMSQLSLNNRGIDAVDLNGDGLEDMLLGSNMGAGLFKYTPYYSNRNPSTGSITFIQGEEVTVNASEAEHQIVFGDYNGDGKVDLFLNLFRSNHKSWSLIFFSGPSSPTNTTINFKQDYFDLTGISKPWLGFTTFTSLDYNGDGKSELLGWQTVSSEPGKIFSFDIPVGTPSYSGTKIREFFSSASNTNFPPINNIKQFGDFNGDGKTDILSTLYSGNVFGIYYCTSSTSNGYQLVEFINISGANFGYASDLLYIVNDFNGDGKADIYISSKNGNPNTTPYNYFTIYYSNGLNFSPQSYLINPNIYGEIFPSIGDFDGNGSADVLFHYIYTDYPQGAVPVNISLTNSKKKLAKTIKDGFNNEVSFNYAPLTNGLGTTVYEKYHNVTYPLNDVQFPMHVVSSVITQDGIGGTNTISYFYKGAILHKTGKGFLGFTEISSTNANFKLKTITEFELFHTDFSALVSGFFVTKGFMTKAQSKYLTTTNTLLENTIFTNAIAQTTFNFQKQVVKTVTHDYLTDVVTTTDYTYDTGGNPETITTNKNNVEISTTTNVYASYGTWGTIKNKLTSTTTTTTRYNLPSYTRSVNFTYDATKGSLLAKILDNGLTTTFEHNNGLGNVTKSTLSGGIAARINSFVYDDKGRYVVETINPLTQHSFASYDNRWGVPLTQTGVDGLITTNQYDQFGRLKTTTTPDNIATTSTLTWEIGGGGATNPLSADNSLYTNTTTSTGSPTQKTWFDSFGRGRKTEIDGFEQKINQVTTYDKRGNVATTTTPFFATDEPKVTTYTYNDLNLSNTIVNEIGTTSFGYVYNTGDNTITTTQTLPDGNSASSIVDATAKLIKATDNGGILDYTYYSSGLQKDIKLNSMLAADMEYDNYGNQTKLTDPNAGVTEYQYSALGEVVYQKDAKNNIFTMTYDVMGRLTTKTENGVPMSYTYKLTGNGINQPEEIIYNGITQHFTYDYLGRLTETKETFEGEDYIFGYQYDILNRIEQTTYPSGFKTRHNYNSVSYPTTITDEQATSTYWQAGSMNAYNQYKTYTLGNGQTTTKTYNEFGVPTQISTTNPNIQHLALNFNLQNGNLMSRANPTATILEEFTYDNLNRLTETNVNGTIQLATNYQSNGNIGFKTDAGNYSYDLAKKNAVTLVDNPQNNISSLLQEIEYTPFNSVSTIIENNKELTFTYGADQQRRKMELLVGGNLQKTTYYFGNYEKIKLANGDITELHYIAGGDGLAAIHVITTPNTQPSTPTTFYTYTDHLGSILTLTDNAGNRVFETNFDAWGRRRNIDDWSYDNTEPFVETGYDFSWLTRGYTGHEHLPPLSGGAGVGSLINMNGRLYDPVLGRMLSPDNYVQDATSTQGYNRYSYVVNNPLKYTDPSGEFWNLVIGAAIGGTINWLTNGAKFDSDGLKYFGVGAAAGALGAGIGAGVNAAIAGNAAAGGGFMAGFTGSATIGSTGFVAGAVTGASAGVTNGLIQGAGNGLISGQSFGDAFVKGGLEQSWKQGLTGAALGGLLGGYDAVKNDRNFWTGAAKERIIYQIDNKGVEKTIRQEDFWEDGGTGGGNSWKNNNNIEGNWRTMVDGNPNVNQAFNNVDGTYTTNYNHPRWFHAQGGASNPTDFILGPTPIYNRTTTIITTLNKQNYFIQAGWRYYNAPVNKVQSLFNWRGMTSFMYLFNR